MINHNEDKINYSGTTIFIVLCFVLFIAFCQNSVNPGHSIRFHYQSSSAVSAASKPVPLLSSLKNFITLYEKTDFKLFNEYPGLLSANRLINQRIAIFRKVELIIKPATQGFRYHYQSLYSEDIPILS